MKSKKPKTKNLQIVRSKKYRLAEPLHSSRTLKEVIILEEQKKYYINLPYVKSYREIKVGPKKYVIVSIDRTWKPKPLHEEHEVYHEYEYNEKPAGNSVRFRVPGTFLIMTKSKQPWRYTDHKTKRK